MPTLGAVNLAEAADAEVILKQFDVVDDAKRSVMGLGFSFAKKPASGFDGQMPKSLTELDDDELGDLLFQLSEWIGWADGEMVNAKLAMDAAQAKVDFLQSHVRLMVRASGEKMTGPDKLDMMKNDKRVIDAEARLLFCSGVYDMIRSLVNRAQKNWDTASRRITQRGQDVDRMKRGENVGNSTPLRTSFTGRR